MLAGNVATVGRITLPGDHIPLHPTHNVIDTRDPMAAQSLAL